MVSLPEAGVARQTYRTIHGVSLVCPIVVPFIYLLHGQRGAHMYAAMIREADGETMCRRFGLVATLLEMIPVANILFTYTNTGEFSSKPMQPVVLAVFESQHT